MLIVALILPTNSAVLGIDIGSEILRASILAPGRPIEILETSDSRRLFPLTFTVIPKRGSTVPDCINFTDLSNFDFVMNDPLAARKYPNSTLHHWSNFVAKLNVPITLELARYRRFFATHSSYENQRLLQAGLLPELVFHRALDLVNASVKRYDSNAAITLTVIVVPKFWPQQERDAIRTVARAKKFSPFIVDSVVAIGTSFAIEQQKYFLKTPIQVVFFDFGASNVQIVVLEFKKTKSKIAIRELCYEWDDRIGGRDLDVALFHVLAARYGYPMTVRGEQMVLLEANKIKHALTTDLKVSGTIEAPDGEHDLRYEITRADFETAIALCLDVVREMLTRIAGNESIRIDRVQLLGGCSRIPCVQALVRECLNIQKLSTNMNLEEAIAVAAAWVGASKSSDYSIAKIDYEAIQLWPMAVKTETGVFPFDPTHLPIDKGPVWLFHNATPPYPIGSSVYLLWGDAGPNTTVRTTKDGLLRFQNLSGKPIHTWKRQLLEIAWEVEAQDTARTKLQETANRLEKLLLDTKQTLEGETRLAEMTTASEREALTIAVQVTDRWFLDQQSFEQESLQKKLTLLEDAVGSVMCRVQNAELLPQAIDNFSKVVAAVEGTVRKWAGRKNKSGTKRRDIRELLRMIADLHIWFGERSEKQSRLKMTDNPSLLWSELRARVETIEKKREQLEDAMVGRTRQVGGHKSEDVYVYPPDSVNVKID
jgi:molecular chaperone DnaK (HSP70)